MYIRIITGSLHVSAENVRIRAVRDGRLSLMTKPLKSIRNIPAVSVIVCSNSINFKRKSFKQYDRRCAFLNEENLCDIYTEAGEKLFCKTCRQYPRHEEEYENVRELSLSLSCPEGSADDFVTGQTESHL